MRVSKKMISMAAFVVGTALLATASASAMPFGLAQNGTELSARLADGSPLIDVRYRRGRGVGAGFAAGVLLGGVIASQQGYYRGYPSYPYYSPAYPVYGPYSPGDPAIAYCMRRFRSYDPYSGTYLGFDGYRHPCP